MMHQRILLGLFLGLSVSGSAYGDLKVLFKFNYSGVEAHRVVEINETGENYRVSLAEPPVAPSENVVIMRWFDADGQVLAVTQTSDPRIASSPAHVDPALLSRVGLMEGAWVDTGPDGTETVNVEFPENAALGLTGETWSVLLRQDK